MQLAFAKNAAPCGSVRNLFRILRLNNAAVIGFAALLSFSGCSTPQVIGPSSAEKQRQELAFGVGLIQRFESEFDFRRDSAICRYLDELAAELTHGFQSFHDEPPRVAIIKDSDKHWHNFGFPGSRIYLSRSLLRSIQFENELAAAIALELAHIDHRDLVRNYEPNKESRPWFGRDGLFEFSPEVRQSALESAMEMMYQAGFDPRGMVRLLERYQGIPEKAPYEEASLKALVENSWRIIALHAPLRNPIIRSDRFLAVYQRMQQL